MLFSRMTNEGEMGWGEGKEHLHSPFVALESWLACPYPS